METPEAPRTLTMRLPSIRDVARAANVSTATVSRALSNPDVVSEANREAVFEAVRTTGYRMNVSARNLRRQTTGAIGVLVPNLANPFFSQILSGIAEVMSKAEINVLITDTTPMALDDHRFPEFFSYHHTDGMIVLDGMLRHKLLAANESDEDRVPIVFACEWVEQTRRASVAIDNTAAAAMAINHLVGLGHRKIGHVRGPKGNVLTIARQEGTLGALRAARLETRDDWMFAGDFTLPSGAEAARRWLAASDRPTAVFCASDEMAMGFISELHRSGVSVPRDVSVVGFDDLEITSHFVPRLTTIHQPRNVIGRVAAEVLLERIKLTMRERLRQPAPRLILPVELVVRESTAPPPL
jgi:LacI family transcriptional regulator, repressor for deo operon, udp, cdd, tsx, nupC, and nupG